MPISRYHIRNVYSLADPDLYKAANKDDPEALLEGVAMSGLVGVLRQLGDLAEFAAEIFHDLHEEVMATAARGHGLLVRVQQLELQIPSIERAFLSQTCHSPFFPNSGVDWHPNRQTMQNLITTGDLPRFVMDSYEDCRGPPRLFLLDKFDVGGAGACLKRYTDPSFYKIEASSYEMESAKTQKNKKIRKMNKKVSLLKRGETPEVPQTSHVKLHQLFLEERVQTGAVEPARRVKLKKRTNQFAFELESGESYMNQFLNSSLEDKLVHEVPICLTSPSNNSNGLRPKILEGNMVGSTSGSSVQSRNHCAASSSVEETVFGNPTSRFEILEDSMVGSALGLTMQSSSPYVVSSVEETICGGVASSVEIHEDSTMGYGLGLSMQSRSPCVASSSVEETVCGDPTSRLEILEDSMVGFTLSLAMKTRSPCEASSSVEETICGYPADNLSAGGQTSELPSLVEEEVDDKQIAVDEEIKTDGLQNGYLSDDVASEMDNYVDALGTMELELETDAELRAKSDQSIDKGIYSDNMVQLRSQSSGSQSIWNLTASNNENHSPRKGITNLLDSDSASTSNEHTSSIGVSSPPRPFACVEIPFHPRVPPEQVSSITLVPDQNITNDICVNVIKFPDVGSTINSTLLVDQVEILEEGTSKEADSNEVEENLTSPRKKEEQEPDLEVNVDGHSTFSFARNSEVDAGNKYLNDTLHRISEHTSSQIEECAAHDNRTVSVVCRCSLPDSVISRAYDQSFGPSAEHAIHDLDVEAIDNDDIHVAEVTADNPPEMYPSPEEQLKEIGYDNILHTSDSAETIIVSYSIKDDETVESNNTKVLLATGVVSDLADSFNSEIGGNPVCIPDDVDKNEEDNLSMLEDYAELERREADSDNSEMEKSADVIAVDANANEDDDCSEPGGQSMMSKLCIVQDSKEYGEKEEEGQLLVISPDSDYVLCGDDNSNKLLFDSIPDASMASDDDNQPSLNLKILHEQTHSFVAETEDPNGLRQVVLCQHEDIEPCRKLSNVGLLDAPDSTVLTEAEHDHRDHVDIFETVESSPMEDKVDQPNDQLHLASQLNFLTNIDHETHYDVDDTQPKSSYPVNLASQGVVLREEDRQQKPTLELLQVSSHDINLRGQAREQPIPVFPELSILPKSAPVQLEDVPPLPPLPPMQWRMRKLPVALLTPVDGGQHSCNHFSPIVPSKADEGPQVVGLPALDEIRNSDTKNHKSQHGSYKDLRGDVGSFSPKVLIVASLHTEDHVKSSASTEINFAENLVPQAAIETEHSQTIPTTSGQEICWPSSNTYPIPPSEEMPTNIQPMKIPRSPLIDAVDVHDKPSASSEADGNFNKMALTEASLHIEDHVKLPASSEAKFAENLVPQSATDTELSRSVPTTSGQEIFWPSSNPPLIPLADEMPTGIRPMKLQRPRSPLIDAVAAHDKSKLRKVADRATPQIPKGEEIDNLLEQIRAKSFNLKPAVQNRPNIQGPTTNLRVAAILQKANAIRQAFVGSDDDDDDSDSWSDS